MIISASSHPEKCCGQQLGHVVVREYRAKKEKEKKKNDFLLVVGPIKLALALKKNGSMRV